MEERERVDRDAEKSVRQRVMATNCNLQFYGSIGEKQKQQQEQKQTKAGKRQEKKQRSSSSRDRGSHRHSRNTKQTNLNF